MTVRKIIRKLESELITAQIYVDAEVRAFYSNIKVIRLFSPSAMETLNKHFPSNLGQENPPWHDFFLILRQWDSFLVLRQWDSFILICSPATFEITNGVTRERCRFSPARPRRTLSHCIYEISSRVRFDLSRSFPTTLFPISLYSASSSLA